MPRKTYFFQIKEKTFSQKFFKKGFNAAACILFALKESAEGFLESLPSSYPSFDLMKWTFDVGPYKKRGLEFKPSTVRTNLCRLIKEGLVAKDPKEKVYYLTENGKKLTAYVQNRFSIFAKPWDGKLRIVIFDVPETKKHWRRFIRQELLLMQYQQLQKSVYVGKYPLAESFCQEIEGAGLGRYVFIFTIDKVDRKEEILKLFEEK